MQLNSKINSVFTHEDAKAQHLGPLVALQRSVASCLLWEDEFYEDGTSIAKRIHELARQCKAEDIAALAIEARSSMNLRHAPLWLTLSLIERERRNPLVSDTVAAVIQRADELCELVAMYWTEGRKPLSAQMKKGLRKALIKFDEYQLAKYSRGDKGDKVKLRDVLRLIHPNPSDNKKEPMASAIYKSILDGTIKIPDTWEVALSGGVDKRETFERLIRENKLGYLALLRNLRNMVQAGVDSALIGSALLEGNASRILPFRFIAAARAVPQLEPLIDQALLKRLESMEPLLGSTVVLVDVSGSMVGTKLSAKSDLDRLDAAAVLASIIPGTVRVFTFSERIAEVPPRKGMAGVDAIRNSQSHSGTLLGQAIGWINQNISADRLIVITDEQAADRVPEPVARNAYMINVASYRNGVGYSSWTHIDGFSENVLRFIAEIER